MSKLLIVIVLVLVVIAVAQLTRLYELSMRLRNKREEDISEANNKLNANLWLVFMALFFGFSIWLSVKYADILLPVSASAHGVTVDALFNLNLVIVWAIFFIVNGLLFFFASKYYARDGEKATFYPDNHKIELLWTVIPSVVLFIVIITGLVAWNDITDAPSEDSIQLELYSRQFDWTARYAGDDNKLGNASFNFISTSNSLGLISEFTKAQKIAEVEAEIEAVNNDLKNKVYSDANEEAMNDKLDRLIAQRSRIYSYNGADSTMSNGLDDKLVKAEFHLPVNKEVNMVFRSQDVIHSAYMPHFRVQMNSVPGMITNFKFTPTITTDSMRTILGDDEFNYILLCNKICGAAHYNMKMEVIIDSEEDYNKWLAGQKTFASTLSTEEATEDTAVEEVQSEESINETVATEIAATHE
jgi:cytochrome c oxidase subunit 2